MRKKFIAALLTLPCLMWPVASQAAEDDGAAQSERRFFQHSPDYYNTQDDEDSDASSDEKKQPKYALLMSDNSYNYYVDTENIQWRQLPYSSTEYMLDAWLVLTPVEFFIVDEPPAKYYLEHYYIRPKKRQVQFLCELEVNERPQNVISEREYNVRNWENLVPGSMEDRIYKALMDLMKDKGYGGSTPPRESFRDMLEEYLRISL